MLLTSGFNTRGCGMWRCASGLCVALGGESKGRAVYHPHSAAKSKWPNTPLGDFLAGGGGQARGGGGRDLLYFFL